MNALLSKESHFLPRSGSITLKEAVDVDSDHCVLLELKILDSLLGGMFSLSSNQSDDSNDDFRRAPEVTALTDSGPASEYVSPQK